MSKIYKPKTSNVDDLNEHFPHDPPNSIQEFVNGNERLSIEKNKTLFHIIQT
jgi:hypothetical protein